MIGINVEETIKRMVIKIEKTDRQNIKDSQRVDFPELDLLKPDIWKEMMLESNIRINEIYYLMQDQWFSPQQYKYQCNKCDATLNLKHIWEKHKDLIDERYMMEMVWIVNIKKDASFTEKVNELYEEKQDFEDTRRFVETAINNGTICKAKAIDTLAEKQIFKVVLDKDFLRKVYGI